MRIKDISSQDRPRERLMAKGPSALGDAELLAIVLVNGSSRENAVEMSKRLLSRFSLSQIQQFSLREIAEIDGIGPVKAMQIIALCELCRRIKAPDRGRLPLKSPKDVYSYSSLRLEGLSREHFMVIMLDSKNIPIRDEVVSMGTLNSSLVHPREIFRSAIKENANSVILVHNHPSGDPSPSDEDIKVTEIIRQAGDIIGIKVLDHVIVGSNSWSSVMGR